MSAKSKWKAFNETKGAGEITHPFGVPRYLDSERCYIANLRRMTFAQRM